MVSYFFVQLICKIDEYLENITGEKISFIIATLLPIYLKINLTRNRQDLYKENVKSLFRETGSC